MPPPAGKGVPIKEEWATYLIGLCMQVPDLWWKGFEGNIVGVDLSAEKGAIYAI
jgi:hypothetical protein